MTLNATSFTKQCPQLSLDPNSPMPSLSYSSEDCLSVNLFVPSREPDRNSTGFTVMLLVYGGGYVIGAGSLSFYDGGVLASEESVIVVTFNYRLGALGFLSTGSDSDLKGNYGMLDQVHATKCVKNNIERFGGDPNKVTLFGQSAGGMSVSLLMLSGLTKGLYRHAILQSGSTPSVFTTLVGDEPKERAKMFAMALGCPELSKLKNCALNKSISDILTAQLKVNSTMLLAPFAPVVDGHFLKDSAIKILKEGKYQKEGNVLIGTTRDDGNVLAIYLAEHFILGLAIAVGVLGLVVITLIIVITCFKGNTKSLKFVHKQEE